MSEDIVYWKAIQIILDNHDFPTLEEGNKMHGGMEKDKEVILGKLGNFYVISSTNDL